MERIKDVYDAMISLTSIQIEGDERNESELITEAFLHHLHDADIVAYDDTETTGFDGSRTVINVGLNGSADIIRTGTANSSLSLEVGKRHYCHYGTPYGSMQIGIYTHEIKNTLREDGKLYMRYTVDVNSSFLSDNEIILKVLSKKPKEKFPGQIAETDN